METRLVGFVYVLTNPGMPGMVKVGLSKYLAEDRARQLSTTSVPLAFVVAHRALTSHPAAVERRAHELLAEHRVNVRREFFTVTPQQAADAVRQASLDVAGIQAWDTEEPVMLRDEDRIVLTLRAGQVFVVLLQRQPFTQWEPIDVWQAHSDGDLLELMATNMPERVSGFGAGDPEGDVDPVPHLNRAGDAANGSIIGKERLEPGQRLLWLDGTINKPACSIALFELGSYCQVICRTWAPRVTEDGVPLILNMLTEDLTPTMSAVTRATLQMGRPALYFRPPHPQSDLPTFGRDPAPANYWLLQLNKPARKHQTSQDT